MASGGSWKLFDNCLIEAVRKKPVLYNKKLKEFKQIMRAIHFAISIFHIYIHFCPVCYTAKRNVVSIILF